jgi:NAD(P)-dependent dehydrogenase (short-subunit alcohol dehydrogenase family)
MSHAPDRLTDAGQPPSGYKRSNVAPARRIPVDLSGTRIVVTGASAGIGHEAALALAQLGADVTVVARSAAKAAAAIDALARAVRGAVAARRRARRSRQARRGAGPGRAPGDGAPAARRADQQRRLLPGRAGDDGRGARGGVGHQRARLRGADHALARAVRAARGRIVYTASTMAGDLDVDDLDWARRGWNGIKAYRQSKQANRMLAWAWARRLDGSGATINVAHPGGVRTNIAHRQRGLWGVLNRLAFLTQRSPRRGGDVLVWLAASPDVVGSAGFYKDRRAIPCQWRDDVDGQERLWALCQRQLATG